MKTKYPSEASITTTRISITVERMKALGSPCKVVLEVQGTGVFLVPNYCGYLISRCPERPGYYLAIRGSRQDLRRGLWKTRLVERRHPITKELQVALKILSANALTARPTPPHLRWRRRVAPARATHGRGRGP